MDICVLNPFFYPYLGGTEKVLFELYSRLSKKHNITVLTGSRENTTKETVEYFGDIKVIRMKSHYIKIPNAPLPYLVMDRIRAHIKEEKADIYHINNRYQYQIDVVNSIKKTKGKLALTIHNALPKNINGLIDTTGFIYDIAWGRALMGYSDLITGVSLNTIKTTVPRKLLKKAHVVYNGVDYNNYKNLSKSDRRIKRIINELDFDGPILFNNARLVQQKGQIHLMRALHKMLNDEYEANLLIVGKGPMQEQLEKAAKKLALEKHFRIMSEIDDKAMPYYYNASDVFVLPSLYEPASVALLEALATMTPSIASKIGGIPEMMGECGFYIKPKSTIDIYKKAIFVLNNQEEAKKRAEEGRERMIREHDWDKIAKQYEELFLHTLNR